MNPKEKAQKLVDKFYQTTPNEAWINEPLGIAEEYKAWNQAKQCALIAVDEIIAELAYIRNYDEEIDEEIIVKIDQRQDFLIEVEKEIKSL
jgi:hypothetical protein